MNEPTATRLSVAVNGEACAVPVGATLAALLQQLGHAPDAVATAVNGEFVARGARADRALAPGDQVHCFRPIVGG
jgi:sulfur carrier protein